MNADIDFKSQSTMSIIDSVTFKGLFTLLILLLCSGLLKEKLLRTPFVKIPEDNTISMSKQSKSEKHFVGLKQDEIEMIKLMANMIVKHITKTA